MLNNMKAISIAIAAVAALAAASPARGNTVPADTLAIVSDAHNVLVVRTPTTNIITITGQGDNKTYYYSYTAERVDSAAVAAKPDSEWGLSLPFLREEKRSKSEVVWAANTQIGICLPVDAAIGLDASIEARVGKFVGLNYTPWAKGPTFSAGAGFFFQKFCLHGGRMFDVEGKSLVTVPLPAEATDTHVRLFNFGFEMPFSVTQKIYRDFAFSLGVAMKFNTYTTASNKYTVDNRSYEKSMHGLQQRILTYDIFAGIGFEDLSLYCRYSPVAMFKSGNGPQFDVISFGLNIGF